MHRDRDEPDTPPYCAFPQEHQLFLQAIKKYGAKEVKMIAKYVGSRNATQVRTHSQKYFMKLSRQKHISTGQEGDDKGIAGNDEDGSSSEQASSSSLKEIRSEPSLSSSSSNLSNSSNHKSTRYHMFSDEVFCGVQSSSFGSHKVSVCGLTHTPRQILMKFRPSKSTTGIVSTLT